MSGTKLIHSGRNRGFLGFITALCNAIELYKHLNDTYNLEYLLTYKLCQDHIENLFSSIRSYGGFNNNPSCTQFQTAFKKLIVHHEIAGSKYGNCSILDATFILPINNTTVNSILEEDSIEKQEAVLHSVCNPDTLSMYVSDIVQYIAGFVVRKLKKKLGCVTCLQYLEDNYTNSILITIKNKGALIKPSKSVIVICHSTERFIRMYGDNIFHLSHIKKRITYNVRQDIYTEVFLNMFEHILSQETFVSYKEVLINAIIHYYIDIRLFYIGKNAISQTNNRIRKKLTKLILFHNE